MAYSWDNRVKFVVRYMYDIDGNGSLDKNDFECLAVRNTVIEGKGEWNEATFKKNQEVMANLWNEIAELADFNKVMLLLPGSFFIQPKNFLMASSISVEQVLGILGLSTKKKEHLEIEIRK